MRWLLKAMVPSVTRASSIPRKPEIARKVVDLPAPLVPRIATIWPLLHRQAYALHRRDGAVIDHFKLVHGEQRAVIGAVPRAGDAGTAVRVTSWAFPIRRCSRTKKYVADAPSSLRLAVNETSTTANNLRRDGRVTLSFVDEHGAWYVKARASSADSPHATRNGVAVFPVAVVTVLADVVDPSRESPARIVNGIRFHRSSPSATP